MFVLSTTVSLQVIRIALTSCPSGLIIKAASKFLVPILYYDTAHILTVQSSVPECVHANDRITIADAGYLSKTTMQQFIYIN